MVQTLQMATHMQKERTGNSGFPRFARMLFSKHRISTENLRPFSLASKSKVPNLNKERISHNITQKHVEVKWPKQTKGHVEGKEQFGPQVSK